MLLAFAATFCPAAEQSGVNRNCQLGDKAFYDGSFEQAAVFYKRYVEESAGNDQALKDAMERYVSASIRASSPDEAEHALDDYEKRFPLVERVRKVLYRADILLLRFKYSEAEALLRNTLADKAITGDLYFQLLSALGFVMQQQEKWFEASEIYSLLSKSGSGTDWEAFGFRQKLYAMIMGDNLSDSNTLISAELKVANSKDVMPLKILSLLLMIQEKRFSELKKTYASLIDSIPRTANPLLFKVNLLAAKHFLKIGAPGDAIVFLKDAFDFAPSSYDRKSSLRLLINAYVEANMKKAAAATAMKYAEFYHDSPDVTEVKIQGARLLVEQKMNDEAINVYLSIIKDPHVAPAERINAAKQAAALLSASGKIKDAADLLYSVAEKGLPEQEQLEAKFILGKFYFDQKLYRQSADVFIDVSSGSSQWKNESMFWAMQALIKLSDYAAALEMSNKILKENSDPQIAMETAYYRSSVLDKLEKYAEAREGYLNFVRNNPDNEHSPAALFDAGNISFRLRDFPKAAEIFKDFVKRYPQNPLAANALYKCLYAAYFNEDAEEIARINEMLEGKYLDSPFAVAAFFWQVDYLRNSGKLKEANQVLLKIEQLYPDREDIIPQALYDRATVAADLSGSAAALELLQVIFDKYPNSKTMADALFLAGDIASGKGNYPDAAIYYRKAAQLRPDSALEIASVGRIGDCNYTQYAKTQDTKFLSSAISEYESILAMKNLNQNIKDQTIYKLGKCYEGLSMDDKALALFTELIYGYQIDKNNVENKLKPVWTVKAAYAAIMIYMRQGTPESASEAIKIYRHLESMHLETGEDFKKIISSIKTKFRI
jgi:TolA-binding protein